MLSHSVVSDSLTPHGLYLARLLCSWDFPGKNTGVGCQFLLKGIFLIQCSEPKSPASPALACRFVIIEPPGEPFHSQSWINGYNCTRSSFSFPSFSAPPSLLPSLPSFSFSFLFWFGFTYFIPGDSPLKNNNDNSSITGFSGFQGSTMLHVIFEG